MGSSDPRTEDGRSTADWLAIIARANAGGDYLQAIDAAAHGLKEHPASLALRYQQLLGYARAGAGRRALEELEQLEAEGGLAGYPIRASKPIFSPCAGACSRTAPCAPNDRMTASIGRREPPRLTNRLLMSWAAVFPAVNAATLWRVAGDPARSARLAREAINALTQENDAYWRNATEGEALCLLGEDEAATRALAAAFAAADGRGEAVAATRRQLDWLSRTVGIGGAALSALPAPRLAHWLAPSGDQGRALLPHGDAGRGLIAFGSLLSQFDCAIAEALGTAGAEINLTLPCAPDICRTHLVERSGSAAGDAFDRSLEARRQRDGGDAGGRPGRSDARSSRRRTGARPGAYPGGAAFVARGNSRLRRGALGVGRAARSRR